MDEEQSIKMDKSKLRKIMATLMREVSETDRLAQSQAIFKRLVKHPKYREAQRVSLYLSTPNEVDTIPILKHSLEVEKKRCFIPVIANNQKSIVETNSATPRMLMVELRSMSEYEQLPVNKWGIREPRASDLLNWMSQRQVAEPQGEKLHLMLVPGVAFSTFGQRLGHGMGYYDEYLDYWNRQAGEPRLYTIGLALRQQLIQNTMSVEGHDYKLNEVLFDGSIVDGE